MKDFKRGGGKFGAKKTGGYKKDGARPSRGGFGASRGSARSFSKPTYSQGLHKAICSSCGKECEVPFKPISGKTVYCKDCFKKTSKNADDRGSREYRPTGDRKPYDRKPAFKRDSSRGEYTPAGAGSTGGKDYSKELADINTKLDHILTVLADLELDSDDDAEDKE